MCKRKLLAAVRREVKRHGHRALGFRTFLKRSGLRAPDVYRNFGRWSEALRAAGYDAVRNGCKIPTVKLLEDYGNVCRKMGRVAVLGDYNANGRFGTATYQTRFDGWSGVRKAFWDFAEGKEEWADVRGMMGESGNQEIRKGGTKGFRVQDSGLREAARDEQGGNGVAKTGVPPRRENGVSERGDGANRANGANVKPIARRWVTSRKRREGAVVFGMPLDFGVLRHEPVNEQGVVFLFALMAERLGFLVETLRMGFPDCIAKQIIGKGKDARLETVRIEFEFESRNFLTHKHPVAGCDLIVCWENNWPECPIEVIALRDEIARI